MLNFLKKLPIKTQLVTLAVSTGTIMLIIIVLTYFWISRVVENNSKEYTEEMTFQIKKYIAENCELIEKLLGSVAYNKTVQKYMVEESRYDGFKLFKEVDDLCLNLQQIKEGIIDFIIIRESGYVYGQKGYNAQVVNFVKSLPEDTIYEYSGNYLIEYNNVNSKNDCFIIATTVKSVNQELGLNKKIGRTAIVVDKSLLSFETNKKYTGAESVTKFYLLDKNNKIYMSNDKNMDESIMEVIRNYPADNSKNSTIIIGKKKYVIHSEGIDKIEGRIVSVIPEKELFKEVAWIRKMTITVFIFAIALLAAPFMVITNNILYPLRTFIKYMKSVRDGNLKGLKQRLSLEGYEEIEFTAREFNSLLDEIDSLTHRLVNTSTRLYETELEKKRAELGYLRSQINPHFIYNTLEVMKGCAVDENAQKTFNVAKSLGQIFRFSVKGADTVTLMEEMATIKSYIQIQQVRFYERFSVVYEFDEAALKCTIPKMILQPIVENAVFHGLEAKLGEGCLSIGGKINEHSELIIRVKDDGDGMCQDTLSSIRQNLCRVGEAAGLSTDDNTSIGIANVNNRIRLIYGDQYGIEINSVEGQGTEVIIKIPAGRDELV